MRKLHTYLFVLCCTISLSAQTAVVTRNVNLRANPSTDNPPLTKLLPGNQLELVETGPTNGYYHVKTATGVIGFVWGKNVQIQPASNAGTAPTQPSTGGNATTSSNASGIPAPLLAKGHPVSWWFVFKFNSASFPKCAGTAQRACLFGGEVQSYTAFSQQFVYASSDNHNLQQGSLCVGDTTNDPLGATFDEVYNGSLHFVIWNDQFYDDPQIAGCSKSCSAPWGHSKGLLAWNDAGDGLVLQVTTPSWPAAGSAQSPRKADGNTLGCVQDNDVLVSQHFFALKLNKDDVLAVLNALKNASVVTDPQNPQIVSNGGPPDVQQLVIQLGAKSASTTFTKTVLSSGVELISKPSQLNVPPWQMVSAVLGGVSLRTATWWAAPKIYTTTSTTTIGCWDSSLGNPGAVEIATTGEWQGQHFGLTGGSGPNFNHAKIGVSTSGTHEYAIFGDMNQQGSTTTPKCSSSQNGRGGLFYVIEDADLAHSVTGLIAGSTAPSNGP
jgi:deoxyribonuclease II/SH3 domain-containing protein